MNRKLWLILCISLSLFLSACGVKETDYEPVNVSSTEDLIVEIPSGSTTKSIAALLLENNLIKSDKAFIQKVKDLDAASDLKAGKYAFSQSMSVEEMVNMVANGTVYSERIKIVIPEGYEVRQIVDKLVDSGLANREALMAELESGSFDYRFLEGVDRSHLLEGFLFPATYQFAKDLNEHEIINQMLKAFDQNFDAAFYDKAKAMNMSIEEVVTLASIIERETKKPEELNIVSSVFHNRLEKPMRLQSCATVQYILGERKEVLSIKDTQIDSPYNTYRNDGLPPAPIASPGKAAIKAALNPDQTPYLFFVTTNNGDGSHYFSTTLEEHNAAIQKSKK